MSGVGGEVTEVNVLRSVMREAREKFFMQRH